MRLNLAPVIGNMHFVCTPISGEYPQVLTNAGLLPIRRRAHSASGPLL